MPLLLIGLLLYNPFLSLASHSDGVTYQAQARHRATVGASEMQHYASMQGETAQPEATVEEIFASLVVENDAKSSHPFQEEILPKRPEPITKVWFRPPPQR